MTCTGLCTPVWPVIIGNETNGCTWTCRDLESYCYNLKINVDSLAAKNSFNLITRKYLIAISFFMNLFLFLTTAFSRELIGTTYIFIKINSALRCFIGAPTYFFIYLPIVPLPFLSSAQNYILTRWVYQTGEMIRSATCIAALFLTLDRFLAVCLAERYQNLKPKKYITIAYIISFLCGSLQLEWGLEVYYVPKNGNQSDYYARDDYLSTHHVYTQYVWPLLTVQFWLVAIGVFICGIGIVKRLHRRGKEVAKMLSSNQAVKEYQQMRYMARLQIIDSVIIGFYSLICAIQGTFDFLLVMGDVALNSMYPNLLYSDQHCGLTYQFFYLNQAIAQNYLAFFSTPFTFLNHGEIFLIYVIFFKKLRKAFFNLFKNPYMKVTGVYSKMRSTQVTPVSITQSQPLNFRNPMSVSISVSRC